MANKRFVRQCLILDFSQICTDDISGTKAMVMFAYSFLHLSHFFPKVFKGFHIFLAQTCTSVPLSNAAALISLASPSCGTCAQLKPLNRLNPSRCRMKLMKRMKPRNLMESSNILGIFQQCWKTSHFEGSRFPSCPLQSGSIAPNFMSHFSIASMYNSSRSNRSNHTNPIQVIVFMTFSLMFFPIFFSLFQGMFSNSAVCMRFKVCARKSGCRMRYCRVSRKTCSPWDITARIVASNMATFAWNFSIS